MLNDAFHARYLIYYYALFFTFLLFLQPLFLNGARSQLKLYSNHGVLEYWIADWRAKQIQVYRRENGVLKLVMTLFETDTLTSPLSPEFSCVISQIFT